MLLPRWHTLGRIFPRAGSRIPACGIPDGIRGVLMIHRDEGFQDGGTRRPHPEPESAEAEQVAYNRVIEAGRPSSSSRHPELTACITRNVDCSNCAVADHS